jgi:Holliday junction resolvase RusA-like endonuclease
MAKGKGWTSKDAADAMKRIGGQELDKYRNSKLSKHKNLFGGGSGLGLKSEEERELERMQKEMEPKIEKLVNDLFASVDNAVVSSDGFLDACELKLFRGGRLTDEQMEAIGFMFVEVEAMGAVRTTASISKMPLSSIKSKANKAAKLRWLAYCEYKDVLRDAISPDGDVVGMDMVVEVSMPVSWSKKDKIVKCGMLHDQQPDVDNFCKAVLDACVKEDKAVGVGLQVKRWSDRDRVWVRWRKKGDIVL